MSRSLKRFHFTTPHYEFELRVTEQKIGMHTFHFMTGNEKQPCLDGIVTLENLTGNERYNSKQYTAKLMQIEALQECSLRDINDEYMQRYSFGKEMLESILFFIHSQFEMISSITLNDTSYIPCIRNTTLSNTLDLLTYSIALYGKTWYEDKLNAYLSPKHKHERYRSQVDNYSSSDTKNKYKWSDFYILLMNGNIYTRQIVEQYQEHFETLFMESKTLPEFFRGISRVVPRDSKCRFFKDWLEDFIKQYITLEREWTIDLYPRIEVISSGGNSSIKQKRRKTQKRKYTL
jgi:hypothetical protein